jgi:plasmanylethanolamine desaturase
MKEPNESGTPADHAQATGFHRVLEFVCTWTYLCLLVPSLFLIVTALYDVGWLWVLVPVIPLGFLASDLFTGMIHWCFDNYGSVDTPVFGSTFIFPFREHHDLPQKMCQHDLATTVGNSCIAGAPSQAVFGAFALFYSANPSDHILGLSTVLFLSTFIALTVATNLFHKWAHSPAENNPAFVALLQNNHLVLNPNHHRIHHSSPYDRYYCITCGWMNPFLERIAFFPRVERALAAIGFHTYERKQELLRYTDSSESA